MFRHTGTKRTFRHNVRLAALLSLTAGMVNVAGFMAFMVLTTNVTGHVAQFAVHFSRGDFSQAWIILSWMLLFLLGAFFSSFYINRIGRNWKYAYSAPILLEMSILVLVGIYGSRYEHTAAYTELFAGSLLFAMGVQNAMVSIVSGFLVRTTHLTGMFTDLGIELSAWVSRREHRTPQLGQRLLLHFTIIAFFFAGAVLAGYLFASFSYYTFFYPAGVLLFAMFYDAFRVRLIRMIRRLRGR